MHMFVTIFLAIYAITVSLMLLRNSKKSKDS